MGESECPAQGTCCLDRWEWSPRRWNYPSSGRESRETCSHRESGCLVGSFAGGWRDLHAKSLRQTSYEKRMTPRRRHLTNPKCLSRTVALQLPRFRFEHSQPSRLRALRWALELTFVQSRPTILADGNPLPTRRRHRLRLPHPAQDRRGGGGGGFRSGKP